MLRVLQVVHQFLPRYTGGTEQYTARVAAALTAQGHACAVFTGGDAAGQSEWNGIPVITVPGGLRGPKGALATFRAAFTNPEAESAFSALLDSFRPDVVHVQHLLGLSPHLPAMASARGVPVVATLHDYWFECANGQLVTEWGDLCHGPAAGINCAACGAHRLNARPLVAAAPLLAPLFVARSRRIVRGLKHARVALTPSDFIAGRALRAGFAPDTVRRVRFGIPRPNSVPVTGRVPRSSDGLRIAYAGSLAPRKGVHVLIEAFQRLVLPRASLTIAGPLDDFPEYVAGLQRSAAASPNIRFTGRLDAAEVLRLLSDSSVLAVPSLWYENAPLVIAEAFAAGTPVVVSRAGALAEMVKDGVDGLHFRMGDADDLARVLRLLATDSGLLARLASGVTAPPTMDDHLAELLGIYRGLAAGAAHGHAAP
jgi:glycosyltransferase involved in cell wall biosynthesis